MTYADSSFLVAAYAVNVHTPLARPYLCKHTPRLPLAFLHWPELAKALWTFHPHEAEATWGRIKADVLEGATLFRPDVDADTVSQRAAGFMRHYANRWPKLRAIDVMHISAAVESRATTFLSFDTHSYQRLLAHAQRLKVWPALTKEETACLS